MSVGEFWELTPRELGKTLEAAGWRAERARERDISLAWHMVALDRQKRLPSLKRLLKPAKARKVSAEELERRASDYEELKTRLGEKRGATEGTEDIEIASLRSQ